MLNISQVIPVRTDSNLHRKELTVHWSAPNSLIRSYLQPCTNTMRRDESEAVAPIVWLYQTVDAPKGGSFLSRSGDMGHDLYLEFSRSNMEFVLSQPKLVRLPQNEKQTYWLNSRPQMWPMALTLATTLTFEFSRSNVILTIWWPRSGGRIYQIVTGVTSDVGVPSTYLVYKCNFIKKNL